MQQAIALRTFDVHLIVSSFNRSPLFSRRAFGYPAPNRFDGLKLTTKKRRSEVKCNEWSTPCLRVPGPAPFDGLTAPSYCCGRVAELLESLLPFFDFLLFFGLLRLGLRLGLSAAIRRRSAS
jgi:hypothetical protein